jgi:prevent-host-death family protein
MIVVPKFNIYQAKARLSSLVEKACHGEEVVIAKAGKPRVRLVPFSETESARRPGRAKGRIRIAEDFDAEFPSELADALGTSSRKRRA